MLQDLTFILLKKSLIHPQMIELYKQILILKFLRDILVRYMQDQALQCNLQMWVLGLLIHTIGVWLQLYFLMFAIECLK